MSLLEVLGLIFGLLFAVTVFRHIYADAKNRIWNALADKYGLREKVSCKKDAIEAVFFWKGEANKGIDVKNEYFNGMYFSILKDGLLIQSPINRYFVKPIFIPWIDIKPDGDFYHHLTDITVRLCIANGQFYLGIPKNLYNKFSGSLGSV